MRNQSPAHATYRDRVETLLRVLAEALGAAEMTQLEEAARRLDFREALNLAESLI